MTATTERPVTSPPAPTRSRRPGRITRFRRAFRTWFGRTYKVVIPLGIAVLLLLVTFIVHAIESVDVKNPDYLNPTSSASIGSLTLANALAAKGITVDRVTNDFDAFTQAQSTTSPVTLFIPSLELMRQQFTHALQGLPSGTRVVIVAPQQSTLNGTFAPMSVVGTHWTAISVQPACTMPEAVAAGAAAADGIEYRPILATYTCYHGGLVDVDDPIDGVDEIVIGTSDPFRNDRINEGGNEALAVGLLSAHNRVIWLDTHTNPPLPPPDPTFTYGSNPGDSGVPNGDGGNSGGTTSDGGNGGNDNGTNSDGGNSGNDGSSSDNQPKPLSDLLPPWVWAGIGLLVLAGIALALAAGRRMGSPINEPLPVAARVNETIEGRGRLYRRTRNRRAVLRVLQGAAIERIRVATGLASTATPAEIVAVTSAYLDLPADEVDRILYGADAKDDNELMFAVASLDAITAFAGGGDPGTSAVGAVRPGSSDSGVSARGVNGAVKPDHNNEGES